MKYDIDIPWGKRLKSRQLLFSIDLLQGYYYQGVHIDSFIYREWILFESSGVMADTEFENWLVDHYPHVFAHIA